MLFGLGRLRRGKELGRFVTASQRLARGPPRIVAHLSAGCHYVLGQEALPPRRLRKAKFSISGRYRRPREVDGEPVRVLVRRTVENGFLYDPVTRI